MPTASTLTPQLRPVWESACTTLRASPGSRAERRKATAQLH